MLSHMRNNFFPFMSIIKAMLPNHILEFEVNIEKSTQTANIIEFKNWPGPIYPRQLAERKRQKPHGDQNINNNYQNINKTQKTESDQMVDIKQTEKQKNRYGYQINIVKNR
ncbi:MAG: hypothetical protein WC516_03150 [Patescibacteria group bacterium]